jgi:hypothetical protein
MRKLVVVGLAAVVCLLGQAFLAGEAQAANKKKTKAALGPIVFTKHYDQSSPMLSTGKAGQNPKPGKASTAGSPKRH